MSRTTRSAVKGAGLRRGRAPLLLAAGLTALVALGGRAFARLLPGGPRASQALAPARDVGPGRRPAAIALGVVEAEVVGGSDGSAQLMTLEADLREQIAIAQAADNPNRVRDLARLLVLAKTAEGIAVKGVATEAINAVQSAVADSLRSFVGKEDYNFDDVYSEITKRGKNAVSALDDIYFEDIAQELSMASKAAVAKFTGKEEYKFGDVSKEIDTRAKSAVSAFTGKEDYKFGDITNEAMKRGGDAVKGFTGKEEYKFGDISKTILKNIFGGDDKK